jgi:hypothetical protein
MKFRNDEPPNNKIAPNGRTVTETAAYRPPTELSKRMNGEIPTNKMTNRAWWKA